MDSEGLHRQVIAMLDAGGVPVEAIGRDHSIRWILMEGKWTPDVAFYNYRT